MLYMLISAIRFLTGLVFFFWIVLDVVLPSLFRSGTVSKSVLEDDLIHRRNVEMQFTYDGCRSDSVESEIGIGKLV